MWPVLRQFKISVPSAWRHIDVIALPIGQASLKIYGEQVAYIRLRHGCFRVDAPICGAKEIFYTEACKGDGRFDDDERMIFLQQAVDAVKKHYEV